MRPPRDAPPARTFTDEPAVRTSTPLLIALVGPSGSGKTFSALRLATGIQRVVGGEIFGVDSEAERMKHYADTFNFRHVKFPAPHSPNDYRAVIDYVVGRGARVAIVDSTSHEHEGDSGVLEMHASELERMGGQEKDNMRAWIKPKQARTRLIQSILGHRCCFIFCFRAKEKNKIVPGKPPVPMGFQTIGGDEWMYEMTLKCLLLPGANGVPTWKSDMLGEQAMIKLPRQFRAMFATDPPPQLTEDIGEQLARWAAVPPPTPPPPAKEMIEHFVRCADPDTFAALSARAKDHWPQWSVEERKILKAAKDDAAKRSGAVP